MGGNIGGIQGPQNSQNVPQSSDTQSASFIKRNDNNSSVSQGNVKSNNADANSLKSLSDDDLNSHEKKLKFQTPNHEKVTTTITLMSSWIQNDLVNLGQQVSQDSEKTITVEKTVDSDKPQLHS